MIKKDIKRGNNFKVLIILISLILPFSSFAENEIVTSPLINLEKLKPSFEETESESEIVIFAEDLKKSLASSLFTIYTQPFI